MQVQKIDRTLSNFSSFDHRSSCYTSEVAQDCEILSLIKSQKDLHIGGLVKVSWSTVGWSNGVVSKRLIIKTVRQS